MNVEIVKLSKLSGNRNLYQCATITLIIVLWATLNYLVITEHFNNNLAVIMKEYTDGEISKEEYKRLNEELCENIEDKLGGKETWKPHFKRYCERIEYFLTHYSYTIGCVVGSFVFSLIIDNMSRKLIIYIFSTLFSISVLILSFVKDSQAVLAIIRLFAGICSSISCVCSIIYLFEINHQDNYTYIIASLFSVSSLETVIILVLFHYFNNFQVLLNIILGISIFSTFICLGLLIESPLYNFVRGKFNKFLLNYLKIAKFNGLKDPYIDYVSKNLKRLEHLFTNVSTIVESVSKNLIPAPAFNSESNVEGNIDNNEIKSSEIRESEITVSDSVKSCTTINSKVARKSLDSINSNGAVNGIEDEEDECHSHSARLKGSSTHSFPNNSNNTELCELTLNINSQNLSNSNIDINDIDTRRKIYQLYNKKLEIDPDVKTSPEKKFYERKRSFIEILHYKSQRYRLIIVSFMLIGLPLITECCYDEKLYFSDFTIYVNLKIHYALEIAAYVVFAFLATIRCLGRKRTIIITLILSVVVLGIIFFINDSNDKTYKKLYSTILKFFIDGLSVILIVYSFELYSYNVSAKAFSLHLCMYYFGFFIVQSIVIHIPKDKVLFIVSMYLLGSLIMILFLPETLGAIREDDIEEKLHEEVIESQIKGLS